MSELMLQNSASTSTSPAAASGVTYTPRFDIWENEEGFVLEGDLPGVLPDDLELKYEHQELMIHGRVRPRYAQGRFLCEEYGVGDFYRSFTIGKLVDEGSIEAALKDGVLTVRLPKRAEARPRKIEIKVN
jgi:HSP20 family protein